MCCGGESGAVVDIELPQSSRHKEAPPSHPSIAQTGLNHTYLSVDFYDALPQQRGAKEAPEGHLERAAADAAQVKRGIGPGAWRGACGACMDTLPFPLPAHQHTRSSSHRHQQSCSSPHPQHAHAHTIKHTTATHQLHMHAHSAHHTHACTTMRALIFVRSHGLDERHHPVNQGHIFPYADKCVAPPPHTHSHTQSHTQSHAP